MKLYERAVKFLCPTFYGGGGGGNTTSTGTQTVYQRNIPPELKPYYELLLNASMKQAFTSSGNPDPNPTPIINTHPQNRTLEQNMGAYGGANPTALGALSKTRAYKDGGAVKGYKAAGEISLSGNTAAQSTGFDPNISISDTAANTVADKAGVASSDVTGMFNYVPFGEDSTGAINYNDYVANFSAPQQAAIQDTLNLQVPYMEDAKLGALNAGTQYQQTADTAGTAFNQGQSLGSTALTSGAIGQQSGLTGQDIGVSGGALYGKAGANAGQYGQDLGVSGGAKYGQLGADYGANAANLGVMSGELGVNAGSSVNAAGMDLANRGALSGQQYENKATSADTVQAYMNPYLKQSLQPQLDLLQQQNDITKQKNNSAAAQASAYGGSRQAVQNALSDQGNALSTANLLGQGYNQAYNTAQNNILQGSQLGQAGLGLANQSLGTALQGTQTGLSGLNQAISGQQAGMQGAGIGLQGVNTALSGTAQNMQGAGIGLQGVGTALQGTAQGMQGAQTGLAGVGAATSAGQYGLAGLSTQQAGLAGMNSSAQNLAGLRTQDLANQQSIIGTENQMGQQIQARDQQVIDNNIAMNDYLQNRPQQTLANLANMLNGVQATGTTMYTPRPNAMAQTLGAAGSLAGIVGSLSGKKEGGLLKMAQGGQVGGIGDLAVYNALNGIA